MSVRITNASTAKAAVSVSEMARMFTMSRSRFYDLIRDGVVPQPVHCPRTKRPLFVEDMIDQCLQVRRTNTAIDGRYVVFYERQRVTSTHTQRSSRRRPVVAEPRLRPNLELVESLRSLGITATDEQIETAARLCFPSGINDLEAAVAVVFRHLRRANGV